MNEAVIAVVGITLGTPPVIVGCYLTTHIDRRLKARGALLAAIGYGVYTAMSVMLHSITMACMEAVLTAWFLWFWWNNGGGDGMRRAFKKLRSRLTIRMPLPHTT